MLKTVQQVEHELEMAKQQFNLEGLEFVYKVVSAMTVQMMIELNPIPILIWIDERVATEKEDRVFGEDLCFYVWSAGILPFWLSDVPRTRTLYERFDG